MNGAGASGKWAKGWTCVLIRRAPILMMLSAGPLQRRSCRSKHVLRRPPTGATKIARSYLGGAAIMWWFGVGLSQVAIGSCRTASCGEWRPESWSTSRPAPMSFRLWSTFGASKTSWYCGKGGTEAGSILNPQHRYLCIPLSSSQAIPWRILDVRITTWNLTTLSRL